MENDNTKTVGYFSVIAMAKSQKYWKLRKCQHAKYNVNNPEENFFLTFAINVKVTFDLLSNFIFTFAPNGNKQ